MDCEEDLLLMDMEQKWIVGFLIFRQIEDLLIFRTHIVDFISRADIQSKF